MVCSGLAATLVLMLVAIIFGHPRIMVGQITDKSVLLFGVHEAFVEGVLGERAAYFERLDPDAVPTRPHPEIRDWDEDL